MDPDRDDLARQILARVVALDAEQRSEALRAACGDDTALRGEVERLLVVADAGEIDALADAQTVEVAPSARPSSSDLDATHGRFLPGQMLGERYRIVGLLGRGGMGEVYRADDLELGQSVALKFLPERVAQDRAALDRFRREVRVARGVAHANVCRVYDISTIDHHVFLSMEYIDGEDLAHVLQRLGRPSQEKAVEISRQICFGVAAAHQNGVLHRDLKPANIMIDGRGRVRITDFGLAGLADELAATPERAGTPAYMAPEQLADGTVSVSSDVYSLGLVLYELFAGVPAFAGNSMDEILSARSSGSVTSISSLVGEIDPAVERVIGRCLEQDPAKRPASVYAVLGALPGGDPLAAALAAGETPSPDLIAQSAGRGGLRPSAAVALLCAVIALVWFIAWGNASGVLFPSQSPTTLSVLAEQTAEKLGLVELPAYDAIGYEGNALLMEPGEIPTRAELEAVGWPPAYRFWRRWSDWVLEPSNFHVPERIGLDDPPRVRPGEVSLVLDPETANLLELVAVPRAERGHREAAEPDWESLLAAAGIDRARARDVPAQASAVPGYCDQVRSWEVDLGDGRSFVATAGASRNRLVFFEQEGVSTSMDAPPKGPPLFVMLLWLTIILLMAVIAVRNLRHGRGDGRSALRFALLALVVYSLIEITASWVRGVSMFESLHAMVWDRPGAHALMHAVHVWVVYMAVEPLVRRVWPRMLVGWVRVLSGEFRDPVVGREVLIGVVAGCAMSAFMGVGAWIEHAAGGQSALPILDPFRLGMLSGHPRLLIASLYCVSGGMVFVMFFVAILLFARLVMRGLTRRPGLGTPLAMFLVGMVLYNVFVFGTGRGGWSEVLVPLVLGVGIVWLCTRHGLLAAFVMLVVGRFTATPFSTDLEAWHAGWSWTIFLALLALSGYGFWVALAGQPFFGHLLGDEPRSAPRE